MFLTNCVYYVVLYVHVGLVMPSVVTSCIKSRQVSRSTAVILVVVTTIIICRPPAQPCCQIRDEVTFYSRQTLCTIWENCQDTNGDMSCCYATGDGTWSDNGGSVRADLSCPSPLFLRPTPLPSDVVVLTKGMQWS